MVSFVLSMDPQPSPSWSMLANPVLTCHPLMFSLQRQMSEQHLRMEGEREREKEREEREKERQALMQLWDKGKSQYSAVASPWVKQKLRQLIKQKNEQAGLTLSSLPTGFRELAPVSDLNFQDIRNNSSSSLNYGNDQLRRTVSEPFLKLKLRRSINNRQSHLHRKSSAPPTVCISTSECSSPFSQSDSRLSAWNDKTNLFHKSKSHLDCGRMDSHPMSSSTYVYVTPDQEVAFPSTVQPVFFQNDPRFLHPPGFTNPHPPVHQVHLMVRPHKLLVRSESQPIVLGQYTPPPILCRANSSRRSKKSKRTEEQRSSFKQNAGFSLPQTHKDTSPNSYQSASAQPPDVSKENCSTGLVYDSEMQKTQCENGDPPPDLANSVWSRLKKCGLIGQCKKMPGRKATMQEIQLVHQDNSAFPYGTNPLARLQLASARMAVGSVTELALRVAQGELKNGFAIVKQCGASHSEPGFFSSVAIAAKQLQHRLSDKKILIVDWDIHHVEIVKNIFYTDPKVLYISLHRYDFKLSPAGGGPTEVGSGKGEGFNVNVPWSGELDPPIGDAEYLAAFRTVVLPIAREFSPDVVLVSSEFNAIDGHPASSGGHRVSANCFGLLTRKLMDLAGGRVVLILEGGQNLMAICDASEACLNSLLEKKVAGLSEDVLMKRPSANAVQSLRKVLQIQSRYWSSVEAEAHAVDQSWMQAKRRCDTDSDAASALASLSMAEANSTRGRFWQRNEPMEHDETEAYS